MVRARKPCAKFHGAESSYPGILDTWTFPDESEPEDNALQRLLWGIVGHVRIDAALLKQLDPFDKTDILVCASFQKQTSVFKLVRGPVQGGGGGGPGQPYCDGSLSGWPRYTPLASSMLGL